MSGPRHTIRVMVQIDSATRTRAGASGFLLPIPIEHISHHSLGPLSMPSLCSTLRL